MKSVILATLNCIIFLFLLSFSTYARVGVGVGIGKIVVDEKLKSGIIYKLPSISVVNTGDESSQYEAQVTYQDGVKTLRPSESWIKFSPKQFNLNPGQVQLIDVTLSLPVNTPPGDYFTYLEGHPINKFKSGNTSIGVAAATKLYFTVTPANLLEGLYYKTISLWKYYQPWTNRVVVLLAIIIIIILIRKFFKIDIKLNKKDDNK